MKHFQLEQNQVETLYSVLQYAERFHPTEREEIKRLFADIVSQIEQIDLFNFSHQTDPTTAAAPTKGRPTSTGRKIKVRRKQGTHDSSSA